MKLPRYQPTALATRWSVWDRGLGCHVAYFTGGSAQKQAEALAAELNVADAEVKS